MLYNVVKRIERAQKREREREKTKESERERDREKNLFSISLSHMQMSSPPDDQKNDALVEKNSIDTIAQFSLTVFPDFCPSWPTKTLTICLLYAR